MTLVLFSALLGGALLLIRADFFFLFGVIRKHDRRLEHSQHKILRGRAEYGYFILIIIVIASNNRRYIL